MVELQLPKLTVRVRFPYPAPLQIAPKVGRDLRRACLRQSRGTAYLKCRRKSGVIFVLQASKAPPRFASSLPTAISRDSLSQMPPKIGRHFRVKGVKSSAAIRELPISSRAKYRRGFSFLKYCVLHLHTKIYDCVKNTDEFAKTNGIKCGIINYTQKRWNTLLSRCGFSTIPDTVSAAVPAFLCQSPKQTVRIRNLLCFLQNQPAMCRSVCKRSLCVVSYL